MILPADRYEIINKGVLSDIDTQILLDLYQPIIGNKAVSFYLTLFRDLEKEKVFSEVFAHHHLLKMMQISLEEVLIAREKLEAVGLLKTYVKKEESIYLYILYNPLSANEFFNHPILNIVLYNNLGKKEYQLLQERYKIPRLNLKEYEDITASFDEVFTSIPTNSYIMQEDIVSKNKNNFEFKKVLDFDLLLTNLKLPEKIFTKEVKSLINALSFLYNVDMVTMQGFIENSLTTHGTIDKELLRRNARNFYQFENSGKLPSLMYAKQPEHLKAPIGGNTNKAKMIYVFETTTPAQFLQSKYKGGRVIKRDMELIETMLVDLKLSPGVVNVLLDYALKVNNQKLDRTYIETIGSHWKRLGIETVEEAMNACLKEHKKRKIKEKANKKEPTKEIVPDWFDQEITKKEIKKEEMTELTSLLKQYH